MRECVDEDLKKVLSLRNAKLFTANSDEDLIKFLKDKITICRPELLVDEASKLMMDMSIKDEDERLARYDHTFVKLMDKA